ncbi:DUF6056 family protein [Bradyrhizobium liaoningense]|uniref:DUF6056 family protein n=1 Tax=Bradyrhizobium liaoningense TaxID=43992 RepID=UPI001BA64791|nr:DUF6056 family protein [Bradyrhizobium liaoningense]MBR0856645.1 hypothetical protein [Bradyrhizobium liaoningense]
MIFLFGFFVLMFYATPEHDDFCFADLNVSAGFLKTIVQFYNGSSGRILPLALIQLPSAISTKADIDLLHAYSMTLATIAVIFVAGMFVVASRLFPRVSDLPSAFLGSAFIASILGASPSVRDLLLWLPAVACYVPPALGCVIILSQCVHAVRERVGFSRLATSFMAVIAFIAAISNEFTGIWLGLIVAYSFLLRYTRGQSLQTGNHLLIAAAVFAGWAIVVLAPGNSLRMATQATGAGDVGRALYEALRFSLVGLGRFLREPAIIGWLLVTALATLASPARENPANADDTRLAFGIIAIALFCCYFAYFAHEYSTGNRIVERAQNQALILLLFSTTQAVVLLTEASRARLQARFGALAVLSLNDLALPSLFGLLTIVSLYFSSTGSLLRSELDKLSDYHQESVQRHMLLATSKELTVEVPKHSTSPALLMSADVTANTQCIARYYGKTAIIPIEPRAGHSTK